MEISSPTMSTSTPFGRFHALNIKPHRTRHSDAGRLVKTSAQTWNGNWFGFGTVSHFSGRDCNLLNSWEGTEESNRIGSEMKRSDSKDLARSTLKRTLYTAAITGFDMADI